MAGDVLELNFRRDRMETFSPVLVKERVLTFGPDGALAKSHCTWSRTADRVRPRCALAHFADVRRVLCRTNRPG